MLGDRLRSGILVLGANGQVGHAVAHELRALGEVTSLDRAGADLAEPESLRAVMRALRPDIVVNAAAYTAVDRAESEPELAERVNTVAPRVIAEEVERLGGMMVHYSTDYVFDGTKKSPYVETDSVNPLSVYGRTKLAGERAVTSAVPRHLILRTSWVISARGSNFVRTILRVAAERDSLRVVADQRGVPTTAALLARVTRRMIETMRRAAPNDARWGTYHVVPAGETTWHELATYLVARARAKGVPLRVPPSGIAAIVTSEYPTAARRPANSRLDTSKLRATFSVHLPDWRPGVDDVVDQLTQQ